VYVLAAGAAGFCRRSRSRRGLRGRSHFDIGDDVGLPVWNGLERVPDSILFVL
jgi:hypothetical protein